MRLKSTLVALVAAAVLVPRTAAADPILQTNLNVVSSLQVTFGQSFTADDAAVDDIAIWYNDFNTFFGAAVITIDLFEGVGYGGALLGSSTRDLGGLSGFQFFDFGHVGTTIGNNYSFRVSSLSQRGAVGNLQHSFPSGGLIDPSRPDYTGGHLLTATGAPQTIFDLTFQVNAASVPEPGTLALLGTGLLLGALRGRRRA